MIMVYGLKRFVDGSTIAPAQLGYKTITYTNFDGSPISYEVSDENLASQLWDKQDCVKNWIYFFVSSSFFKYFIGKKIAHD